MTIDEILAELPKLTLDELQILTKRLYELTIDATLALSKQPISEKQKAQIEAMLAREKRYRDSLNFTTTPEEIDGAKRQERL